MSHKKPLCTSLCTQVLGGYLAARFSGCLVMGLAVLGYSTATLLTPAAADHSFNTLLICRVLLGMGEGLTLPALHHVTARWAPVHERARFVTVSVSGQYLGTSLTLLCAPMVSVWWPGIFYLFGGLGIAWVVVWAAVGSDVGAGALMDVHIGSALRAPSQKSLRA